MNARPRTAPAPDEPHWVADAPVPPRNQDRAGTWWGLTPSTAIKAAALILLVGIVGAAMWRLIPAPAAVAVPEDFFSAYDSPPTSSPLDLALPDKAGPGPAPAEEDRHQFVHVAGAVHSPGLVELVSGSRVADAVEEAGGALPEADLNAVNLAALIEDGQQIYLPEKGEHPGPAPAERPGGSGLVNINTATDTELQQLPGIGPVMSQRIVTYRQDHGPFKAVGDLQGVPGVGPAIMAQIKDGITV